MVGDRYEEVPWHRKGHLRRALINGGGARSVSRRSLAPYLYHHLPPPNARHLAVSNRWVRSVSHLSLAMTFNYD